MSRKGANRFPELIPRVQPIVIPQPAQVVPEMVPVGPVEKVKDPSKVKSLDELKTKMNMIEVKLDLLLSDPEKKINEDPKIEFKEMSEDNLIKQARTLARASSKGVKVPSELPHGAEFRVSSGNLMDEALKLKYKSRKGRKE